MEGDQTEEAATGCFAEGKLLYETLNTVTNLIGPLNCDTHTHTHIQKLRPVTTFCPDGRVR